MPPCSRHPHKLEARLHTRIRASTTMTPGTTRATGTLTPVTFGTSGELELSPVTSTLHRPSSTFSTVSDSPASTTASWVDHLPDLPSGTVWVLAGGLSFLLMSAICLLMINFYPRQPHRPQLRVKREYREVPQADVELDSYCTSRTPVTPQWQNAWPQYAPDRAEGSPQAEDRVRMLRRRKPKNLSIDTTVQYRGLGIAVPRAKPEEALPSPPRRASNDGDASSSRSSSSISSSSLQERATNWTPLPSPLLLATEKGTGNLKQPKAHANKTARRQPSVALNLTEGSSSPIEPQPSHISTQPEIYIHSPTTPPSRAFTNRQTQDHPELLRHHRTRLSDLEAGTLAPTAPAKTSAPSCIPSPEDSRLRASYPSPDGNPDSSHSNSKLNLLLEKGEDAIDYAARKMVSIMYDQVKKGDPEEGLLLPVRSCEREHGGECGICCKDA